MLSPVKSRRATGRINPQISHAYQGAVALNRLKTKSTNSPLKKSTIKTTGNSISANADRVFIGCHFPPRRPLHQTGDRFYLTDGAREARQVVPAAHRNQQRLPIP